MKFKTALLALLALVSFTFAGGPAGTVCAGASDTFLTCNPANTALLPDPGTLKSTDAFSVRVGNGDYRKVTLSALTAYTNTDTSFVDSVRGYTTVPTVTVSCTRLSAKARTCYIPAFTGTSNATTLTLDAFPTGWRPNAATAVGGLVMTDNTSTTRQTAKVIAGTNGVLTFTFADSTGVSAAWTNSGTKALAQGFQITFTTP